MSCPPDDLTIDHLVRRILELRARGTKLTLLAVCPNSSAVLEAAVLTAARNRMPMLLAATLNQVDRDGGYTGWTPSQFVRLSRSLAARHKCASPVFPCLDHGGPWLKDAHTQNRLSLEATTAEVRDSIAACIGAGYRLLHIDPTVDRSLPAGASLGIDTVIRRTVEFIEYAESQRKHLKAGHVAYEVGTEEIQGGLVDLDVFDRFLDGLRNGLDSAGLTSLWPCFIVGRVGTDLHTVEFDEGSARALFDRVAPRGSLVKGHYTDWVSDPRLYPETGMGGANVGPELTAAELEALRELVCMEAEGRGNQEPSNLEEAIERAVAESGRWMKWVAAEERPIDFFQLPAERRKWLVATGARYVWADSRVMIARGRLYRNLNGILENPDGYVVGRIAERIQKYVDAFNLRDSMRYFS